MKIGISSFAFRWAIGTPDFTPTSPLSISSFLEKSAELGAEAVQICENLSIGSLDRGELDDISQTARDLGLDIEIGMTGATAENIRKHLSIASGLGVEIIRVVISGPGWEPALNMQFEIFRSLLPELEDTTITLAIENHFIYNPADLSELVFEINSPRIAICLDPLNSITGLLGPQETIRILADRSVTAHAKDAQTARYKTGFQIFGCPLGEGLVDLQGMVQKLKQNRKARTIHVEAWMDRQSSEQETLSQEEAWVCAGIRYLRSLI